jgi:hypothetical protein
VCIFQLHTHTGNGTEIHRTCIQRSHSRMYSYSVVLPCCCSGCSAAGRPCGRQVLTSCAALARGGGALQLEAGLVDAAGGPQARHLGVDAQRLQAAGISAYYDVRSASRACHDAHGRDAQACHAVHGRRKSQLSEGGEVTFRWWEEHHKGPRMEATNAPRLHIEGLIHEPVHAPAVVIAGRP